MKRTFYAAAMALGLLTAACSHSNEGAFAPSAPTVTARTAASTQAQYGTKTVVSPGLDFSDTYLGLVTVTNNDSTAHRFAFYVWDATNETNQQLKARDEKTIAPGQSATISIAFQQYCGAKYQRDVYRDIQNYQGATTEAEVQNYFFGAAGAYWQSEVGTCDAPTVPPVVVTPPPPPATCENPEANNFHGLLPCTFGEGVIIVEDPPVDVVVPPTEPQKFLFCHVDVNVTGGKNPKTIVHEQQVGGLNGIPLSSITNAHSVGAPHGVTTEHLYDYYGVCDGRGIGQQ